MRPGSLFWPDKHFRGPALLERFEYFRRLARIATGQQPAASLLEVQDRYDTYFDDSLAWRQARSGVPRGA